MTIPRIIIAGTHSGSGKTTVVMGIGLALTRRGMKVQPFKTGPDYIDPGFHSHSTGRTCRNLDSMLLDRNPLLELFHRSSKDADISLVEGVMGLYDGVSGTDDRGSSASLARLSRTPVILVVDAKAMARSAAAIVLGFDRFDPSFKLAGVIFNRIGSPRHYEMIKTAVESTTDVPVLGYIPRDSRITMPERHLGLVPAWEKEGYVETERILTDLVEKHINLEGIISIARSAEDFPLFDQTIFKGEPEPADVRIAVAMDDAFHFYYQDNLDLLEHMGATLVPFSPVRDRHLPEEISAIYIGGGFPELLAKDLESNNSLKEEIRDMADRGMPIYAECGGLMYLVESMEGKDERLHQMVGIFPGRMVMKKKLRSLGYCDGLLLRDTVIGPQATSLRGHVFHWSAYEGPDDMEYALKLTKGDQVTFEGLSNNNVMASYLHIHFASSPKVPQNILKKARMWQKKVN